ncbi:MAG: ATP-binding protein [Sumerlaeia bacterium]
MKSTGFATKFLSRIGRIDTPQIESFLTQLVREKVFLGAVFDSLAEGVMVVDSQGRLVFYNETAKALLGFTKKKKVTGKPIREMLRVKALQELFDEFQAEGHPVEHREIRIRTPHIRIYAVSVVPIEDEKGHLSHAVWIVSDQTETHRRAAEAHQMDSMRSLATLTAGIAHEIKNPLNSMTIHAQLISKSARNFRAELHRDDAEPTPDLQRLTHSTDVLLEEISRLTRIVDQFIRAVRPANPNMQPCDLRSVLESVADLIRPECEERRIEVVTDFDPLVPKLQMDPEQIHQALLNIAKNAMEAIDKPEGRIVLRTALKSDHVQIEVEDNGCGIPPEDRLAIFEPYHTTKAHGTGLGLMVVFRIVSAHQGALGLDSEVGEGTVFKIALPLDERPVRLLEADVRPSETASDA